MDPQNGHEDDQHTDHDPGSESVDHHAPDTVPDWSELGRGTRKSPKGVREILKAYFNDTQIERADQYHSFFTSWKQLAGINIAAHTHPRDIRGRVLIVEADHPGWVQLLHMQKRSILRKISRQYPELEVKDIRIVVGGGGDGFNATDRSAPSAAQGTPATPHPAPASDMPRESEAAPSSGRKTEGLDKQPPTAGAQNEKLEEEGDEQRAEPPEDPQHKNRFEEALKELGKRVEERENEDE